MSSSPPRQQPASSVPGGPVMVAMAPDRARSRELSVVLLAKNVTHWTEEGPDGVAVYVPAEEEDLALEQLAAYTREQREQRQEEQREQRLAVPEDRRAAWPGLLAVGLLMAGVHWLRMQGGEKFATAWSRDGVEIFREGEWWRPFTALWVHADMGHLLSNLSFGALLGWFVLKAYGVGWGWVWIFVSGVLANVAVAAAFWPERFAGVGASTAVFATVGLLVAHGVAWASGRGLRRHRSWLVPLGGGLALLGLFGSGGESADVDVAAHLFGFGAGLAVGAAVSWAQRRRLAKRLP